MVQKLIVCECCVIISSKFGWSNGMKYWINTVHRNHVLAGQAASIIQAASPLTMTISMGYIVLSIGVSGGIGIVFGIYPAYTASKLDPIEALRQDR